MKEVLEKQEQTLEHQNTKVIELEKETLMLKAEIERLQLVADEEKRARKEIKRLNEFSREQKRTLVGFAANVKSLHFEELRRIQENLLEAIVEEDETSVGDLKEDPKSPAQTTHGDGVFRELSEEKKLPGGGKGRESAVSGSSMQHRGTLYVQGFQEIRKALDQLGKEISAVELHHQDAIDKCIEGNVIKRKISFRKKVAQRESSRICGSKYQDGETQNFAS